MGNHYRVLLPLEVHTEDGSYKQGQEFEKDFTAEDEAANLASGLLELLPNEYQVVGDSEVDGHKTGETYSAAIPLGREALLVAGGHIQRLGPTKTKKQKEASK